MSLKYTNPLAVRKFSTAGYIVSAIIFLLHGPYMWLQCQYDCTHLQCYPVGTGMTYVLLSVASIIPLLISLTFDLIAIFNASINPWRIIWLNGSSILGIIICVASFTIRLIWNTDITGNCFAIWGIQTIILAILIIIPPFLIKSKKQ